MYLSVIVLAAGKGERFKSRIPKPVVRLNSRPVIIYSLDILSRHPVVKEIILVVNSLNHGRIVAALNKYRIPKISRIIEGGDRRQDSVYNGLKAVDEKADLVLIHDSGRPFIDKRIVDSVIRAAGKYGAAIVGVPLKSTVKRVHGPCLSGKQARSLPVRQSGTVHGYGIVEETIDRSNLWEIQTPQVFKKDLILRAFEKFNCLDVTDDAMLVEKLKYPVMIVRGSYFNIKITTPEDLIIAEAIVKRYERRK